jgi:hypothetical protein
LNSRRILFITCVLLLIGLVAPYFLPARVYAATTITLQPATGNAGSKIAITGDGFIGKLATIYWDEQKLIQNVPVSKDGQINYTFEIPSSSKGDHIVKVTDDSNWATINASYTFSVKPSILAQPSWGKPPNSAIIQGRGFGKSEAGIVAFWDGTPITKGAITADKSGSWYASFTLPSLPKGEYMLSAKGDSTPVGEVKGIEFTIAPFCKATPLTGPVGTKVLISGVGFRPGEDGVTFTWDGPIIDTNFTAQPNGTFTYPIIVPPSTKGKHIIGIYGSSFTPMGIVPDIEFEVTPTIMLTPSDMVGSREIEVKGYGFNASETISISYDKANTGATTSTDGKGSFTTTFQMPVNSAKEHVVTATGSKGAVAQANHSYVSITPSAPQLLFPGPGARIESSSSVIDLFTGVFSNASAGNKPSTTGSIITAMNWSVPDGQPDLTYTLQISKTSNFADIAFTLDQIPDESYNLTKVNLPSSGSYFWRIRATNNVGTSGPWSNNWSFEVAPTSSLTSTIAIAIVILLLAIIVFAMIALINRRRNG